MTHIPFKVRDRERIVRIAVHPRHFKKDNKPTSAIFRSPGGKDEISVIRHEYKDTAFCKQKGLELQNAKTSYKGLVVIFAKSVRELKSDVIDTREEYYGHADIRHGYIPVPNEPLPGDLIERLDKMLSKAKYYEDPNAAVLTWTGHEPLIPPYFRNCWLLYKMIRIRYWVKKLATLIKS